MFLQNKVHLSIDLLLPRLRGLSIKYTSRFDTIQNGLKGGSDAFLAFSRSWKPVCSINSFKEEVLANWIFNSTTSRTNTHKQEQMVSMIWLDGPRWRPKISHTSKVMYNTGISWSMLFGLRKYVYRIFYYSTLGWVLHSTSIYQAPALTHALFQPEIEV